MILDSPVGLHQGGQVSAPIFRRVAQQVLEYLHVPHDVDVKSPQKETLTASVKDVDESSDRLGAPLSEDQQGATQTQTPEAHAPAANKTTPFSDVKATLPAPAGSSVEIAQAQTSPAPTPSTPAQQTPGGGTVVLDVDSGVVVPSFLGKPLRSAVETAQQSGLEINAIGSGVAREQWPAPGARLLAGQHITVRFAH